MEVQPSSDGGGAAKRCPSGGLEGLKRRALLGHARRVRKLSGSRLVEVCRGENCWLQPSPNGTAESLTSEFPRQLGLLEWLTRAALREAERSEADKHEHQQASTCFHAWQCIRRPPASRSDENRGESAKRPGAHDKPEHLPPLLLQEFQVLRRGLREREWTIQVPLQCRYAPSDGQLAASVEARGKRSKHSEHNVWRARQGNGGRARGVHEPSLPKEE
mmetsp:Transcript_78816/g.219089  ORF Transcript_78816/g.219089 Transcript_78816/m.219089 type:complete len:218 (-) Transcript_78816:475-1128(-)